MAITYYPAIPTANDDQDQSQPQILANFTGINNWTAVNHYNFADADAGKHAFLQLPEQGAAPTTAANEGAFYTKVGANTTVTELAFRRESSGTAIEMTAGSGTNGWTMLPSGLLIKWGVSGPFTGDSTINFPTGASIPVFSAIYTVMLTPQGTAAVANDSVLRIRSFTTTTYTAYVTGTVAMQARFLAIGLP